MYQANLKSHHEVTISGGFGGMFAAKAVKHAPVEIALLDKRNFHLFQPSVFQVACGSPSPTDIASSWRTALKGQKNITVLTAEVMDII